MMKKNILIGLLLFISVLLTPTLSEASQSVVVKVNILNGEQFAPYYTDTRALEDYAALYLKRVGFTVYRDSATEGTLYVDLFIYQFLYDNPTASITFRTSKGVHHFGAVKSDLFINREQAFSKCINTILEDVPLEIDTTSGLNLTLEQLLQREPRKMSKLDLVHNLTQKEWQRRTSSFNLRTRSDTTLKSSFVHFVNFNNYMLYAVSMYNLKPKYKDQILILNLKVDAAGRISINKIECNINVNRRLEHRIADFVAAMPFHTGKYKPSELTLTLNVF